MSEHKEGLTVNVSSANGTPAEVLLGSAFHVLEDKTVSEFVTESLNDFVEFVGTSPAKGIIYYDENTVQHYPIDIACNTEPFATCNLSESNYLKMLRNNIGRKNTIATTDELLSSIKTKIDRDGIDLLDKVRDFKIAKVTTIARQKLQNGNMMFSVKREGIGQGDVEFLEKIVITVPLFEHLDDTIDIELEVWFDYSEGENGPQCVFMLRNLDIDNYISQQKKEMIADALSKIAVPKYFGTIEKHVHNDGWRFKENKLPVA